jgi:hypothetical protein
MTPPTYAGPGTGFADEVVLDAPELAGVLEAARTELSQMPVPPLDDRLEALFGSDGGSVVPLAGGRRAVRRMAIAGGAVVAVVAATTGLAAASVLPAPVQRVVAEAAERVGIDLPRPERQAERAVARTPTSTAAAPAVPRVASGTTPASTATTAGSRPAATAATARRAPASAATTPVPTAAAVRPNAPSTVQAFLAAVAEFRACVAAAADRSACTPPDPAAFGVPASAEPGDVAGFRKAILAYLACLRSGDPGCARPRPSEFGLVPTRPTAPPTTTARPTPSAPELADRLAAFRAAVLRYVACLADRDRRAAASCVRPDPAAFGLPGWPAGLPVPPRPAWPTMPTMSSPPVNRIPPAPAPGVTDTSTRRSSWGGSSPERAPDSGTRHRTTGWPAG